MSKSLQLTSFNFDTLAKLHKENPIAGEQMRVDIITAYIESLPEDKKHRYYALQHSIDHWRSRIKNDDARFEIMKAHFYDMAARFQNSWSLLEPDNTADILPFEIPVDPKE